MTPPKPSFMGLSHDFRLAPCFGRRESCEELASLLGPTSSHLAAQDHQQGATVRLSQVGVSALLPPPRLVQKCSAGGGALPPGCSIAPNGRHHGGVNGHLNSGRLYDDFQPAVVHLSERKEIHVLHQHICCDLSACLPKGSCTSGAPMPLLTDTLRDDGHENRKSRPQRQRLPEATKKQHPERDWKVVDQKKTNW